MGKRKQKSARLTVQLELFPQVALPLPVSGLWKEVEDLPAKVERLHRARRKLVQVRLEQVDVQQLLAQPPHLTQAQADALDCLVVATW